MGEQEEAFFSWTARRVVLAPLDAEVPDRCVLDVRMMLGDRDARLITRVDPTDDLDYTVLQAHTMFRSVWSRTRRCSSSAATAPAQPKSWSVQAMYRTSVATSPRRRSIGICIAADPSANSFGCRALPRCCSTGAILHRRWPNRLAVWNHRVVGTVLGSSERSGAGSDASREPELC